MSETGLWRTVRHQPLTVAALVFLVLVVSAAVAAPWLAPYDPTATDLFQAKSGPGAHHLLGTDSLGRDVLSRIMYGGRVTLTGAAVAVLTVLVLGVCAGLAAGFLGGWVDRAVSWVVDLVLAVPVIVTLLVVLAVVGSNETAAMIALGCLGSPMLARVVRAATLAVRQELYIAAARVGGVPGFRIVTRHVLPRVAGPITVQTSLFAGTAVLAETGLGYLGLGVQPPTPSWGNLVADASTVISSHPWLLVPSGLVIALTVLSFGLIGDALRDSTRRSSGRVRVRAPRQRHPAGDAPPRSGALLSVRGLSVSLPRGDGMATVVAGLDLEIGAGETVGLVGESGCGKSMTAMAVLGLLPAGGAVTAGGIRFDGHEMTGLSGSALRRLRGSEIALISQEPLAALDPMYTVGQQLDELVRRHHGGGRQAVRDRTLELLRTVNLPDVESVARRYPHQLSGGMAQRVAIAMALSGGPKLLIADEPTTALDVTVQAEILELLRRLQEETGMAILLISHNWGVVDTLCRRAYVMYAGQAVETAGIGELLARPRHPYTSGLLGATPRRAAPRTRLATITGTVPPPGGWPDGCHFAPRCALATEECRAAPVPLLQPEAGHHTRCLRHDDLSRLDRTVGSPA